MHPPLILGTRGSQLALWQARHISDRLQQVGVEVDLQIIKTQGDKILDVPLADIGSKALFTKELDEALLDGRIHLAVHSLKDLPTALPDGITLAAVTEREDPRDAFIAHPDVPGLLADLPEGSTLATSSLRRQAQLRAWRPDVWIVPVRGNVDTRLAKLDASGWQGMILAVAGIKRLGLAERIREPIDPAIMLPAVGQGALGVVCATSNESLRTTLTDTLQDAAARAATDAERAFLRRLEGGCQVPVGAFGRVEAEALTLEGCVASLDGQALFRDHVQGRVKDAPRLGEYLAELLLEQGAGRVLQQIRSENANH